MHTQPPIVLNVIRSRSSFLAGMEKKQRRDPKAWPRNNPDDVNAAEAFTQGMRYVVDKADYASSRSQAGPRIAARDSPAPRKRYSTPRNVSPNSRPPAGIDA